MDDVLEKEELSNISWKEELELIRVELNLLFLFTQKICLLYYKKLFYNKCIHIINYTSIHI